VSLLKAILIPIFLVFTLYVSQAQNATVQAAFTATPTKGNAPLTVAFDASTSTGGNLTYQWDFGDGTTGTGTKVSHIYEQLGSYTPKLVVTNSKGSSTSEDRIVVSTYTEGSRVVQLQPNPKISGIQLNFGRAEIGRDIAYFGIAPDAIVQPTEAKFSLSSQAATTYPEGASFEKLYPKGNVVPIGPLVTFELPYNSISTSASESLILFIVKPAIYENVEFEDYAETGIEVRIQRADGTEKFYLEDSFPGGRVVFTENTFTEIYKDNSSAIIRVSVQPVDYLGVTKRN
jgi:PKD repeat protein